MSKNRTLKKSSKSGSICSQNGCWLLRTTHRFLIACRYLYSKLGAWMYFYISEFAFQCLSAGVSSLKIFIWPNGESMINVDLLYHFCAMSFHSVKKWKFLSKTFKVHFLTINTSCSTYVSLPLFPSFLSLQC